MWLQQHHTRSEGVWLVSYNNPAPNKIVLPRSVKRAILDLAKIYNAVPIEQETLYLAMLDREYTACCAQAMT